MQFSDLFSDVRTEPRPDSINISVVTLQNGELRNIEFGPRVRCFLEGVMKATHYPDCFCIVFRPFEVFIEEIVALDAVMVFVFLQGLISVKRFGLGKELEYWMDKPPLLDGRSGFEADSAIPLSPESTGGRVRARSTAVDSKLVDQGNSGLSVHHRYFPRTNSSNARS